MPPLVATTVAEVRRLVAEARSQGQSIGFVPTMGALHAGHMSLCEAARTAAGFVVVSIFVNPTQFGPNEDLSRYPRPFEDDLKLCAEAGVDVVFHPAVDVLYPAGYHTYVEVEGLQDTLCGASRPGHFRGVCTIVLKLFHIVGPDLAFFGQKDAQQVRIIQQMVRDLDVPVEIRIGPTVREPDGLALSSRNRYLDADQRRRAVVLYRALQTARSRIAAGERDAEELRRGMTAQIEATPGAALDYVAVADADTLRPMARLEGTVLLALAVKFGGTRLIDNLLVDLSAPG
jgi:pantoate--beta-alanine ligase